MRPTSPRAQLPHLQVSGAAWFPCIQQLAAQLAGLVGEHNQPAVQESALLVVQVGHYLERESTELKIIGKLVKH